MNKEIIILGAGESGIGAALLAKKKGFDVFVSDKGAISLEAKEELGNNNIPFEENMHSEERILNAAEVIKSPGIPDNAPIVKALHQKGIPVISEIEFAGRYSKAFKIGITGSNGKTTTTLWIYHILKQAGVDVVLAGNIGTSFARVLTGKDPDVAVIELSSFQLDGMYDFKCDIAIITNITPDHLNRYNYEFQNYINSKFRIIQNQTPDDVFIYNADDKVIERNLKSMDINAQRLPFSLHLPVAASVVDERVRFSAKGAKFDIPVNSISLKGKHNIYNAMAAALATFMAKTAEDDIRAGLLNFKEVEHRLEFADIINGVTYINDSKATNVDSAWFALDSMTEPVIWIAGGTDKGNDYSALFGLVRAKVKALVCLGANNSKLMETFEGMVPIIKDTRSMNDAINYAASIAKENETVLLSPACASFDLFNNYEHRGEMFKKSVSELRIENGQLTIPLSI